MGGELRAGPADEPDRYTLWTIVGGGAEGKVYRATRALPDGHLDVAVKEMLAEGVARLDRGQRADLAADRVAEERAERWETHAARLRNLRHPGLVGVQEAFVGLPPHPAGAAAGAPGQSAYFVMAWVEGVDFGAWVTQREAAAPRLAVLENVADALDELHRAGQVHADVKPGNIIVQATALPTGTTVDSAVLVDFGVMRSITQAAPPQVDFSAGYAAPELWQGQPYSPASDLYALAGVVVFALSGEHPAAADAAADAVTRLRRVGVPNVTVEAVASALNPDPAQRPSSGCRAWLATARGGLTSTATATSTVPPPTAVATPAPEGDGKPRRLGSTVVKVAVSLSLTITGAVTAHYVATRGDTPDIAAADEPTTTESTSTTSTSTSTTSTTLEDTTSIFDDTTSTDLGGNVTPGDVYLSSFTALQDSQWFSDTDVKIDGKPYLHGIKTTSMYTCHDAGQEIEVAEYSIDRRFNQVSGVMGLNDESVSGVPVKVEVLGDGAMLWTGSVQVGKPLPITVKVPRVLRLRLVATRMTPRANQCDSFRVAFGDPLLR